MIIGILALLVKYLKLVEKNLFSKCCLKASKYNAVSDLPIAPVLGVPNQIPSLPISEAK